MTADQAKHARRLLDAGEVPAKVARSFGVGRTSLYRHLAKLAPPAVCSE
jgi:DNA invertase Pin-like site-specific DNA recombinase